MGDRSRRTVSAWFVVQAAATVLWWAAMALSDGVRRRFELDPGDRGVLDAYVLGDAAVLVAGGLAAALGIVRARRWAPVVAGAVAGGAGYATLSLVAWVAGGGDGRLGVGPMVVATAGSTWAAVAAPRR